MKLYNNEITDLYNIRLSLLVNLNDFVSQNSVKKIKAFFIISGAGGRLKPTDGYISDQPHGFQCEPAGYIRQS